MKKGTLRKMVLITAAIAVAALGIAALIGLATSGFRFAQFGRSGGGTTVDEKASVPVSGVEMLAVNAVSENVRILEGSGSGIEAWFHGTVGTSAADAIPHMITETKGSTAQIRVERRQTLQIGFAWSDLVLEIRVPAGYGGKISVGSVSGDIEIAGHAYTGIALASTSGGIRAGAMRASDVTISSTSGDVAAESLDAQRSELSTVSGSIEIKALTGDASAHTVSGDVKLTFAAAPSLLDASSTSGALSVTLPANAGFRLDARSTSGDVRCAFPVTVSENRSGGGQHSLAGTVGSGAGAVSLRTVSGDIRVGRK